MHVKIKIVWLIFFSSIISLLVFQTIWLHNLYQAKKNDLKKSIKIVLQESIDEEVRYRFNFYMADEKIIDARKDPSILLEAGEILERVELDEEETLEAGIYQQLLNVSHFYFNLPMLDSIFKEKLTQKDMLINYHLSYKDSTGILLEQTGNLEPSRINEAFVSEPLLIVEGKRIQAIVDISPLVVFQQMTWLLVASFLVLLIIIFCIFFQAKTIFSQYKLNQLREDFTHALTHDMKTPLGTINTVLYQFRSGVLDNKPDLKEKFGTIGMNQVSSLLMLVEKILTIAKLEQGKLELDYSLTNISQIVGALKERFSVLQEKQVVIHSSFEEEDLCSILDPILIKDAIGNLIENSIKYSGDMVEIFIDSYARNGQLFIRVKDNGLGIPPKDQQNIFEKFERGAAVNRKKAKGFGLGLSYVKRVVEAHGGIVMLYSIENKGSEFSLILPFKQEITD